MKIIQILVREHRILEIRILSQDLDNLLAPNQLNSFWQPWLLPRWQANQFQDLVVVLAVHEKL